MKIRVLGCSGSIGQGCRTTSFLVDDRILVDAGTGVGDLTLEEMARVDHVLLTHSHLDHWAALPLMLDAVSSVRLTPLKVHALQETIDALRAHVFNHVIWPDFARLPSPQKPFLSYHPFEVGQTLVVAEVDVEVLPARHTVPAVGFALRGDLGWWVFSGDTEGDPLFWERVNALPVASLVIETAFSNREQALARASQHLSPASLARGLTHLRAVRSYPIYITHTKPSETALIMEEVNSHSAPEPPQPALLALRAGDVLTV